MIHSLSSYFSLFHIVLISMILLTIESPNASAMEGGRKSVVFLFCDLTNSVDSSSIPRIANQVSNFIKKLPWEAELFIYAIDCPFKQRIAKYELPGRPKRESEIRNNKLNVIKAADAIKQGLIKLYNSEYAGNTSACSCILETLQVAQDQMAQYDTATHVFDLVYFSDLLEHCSSDQKDTLNFKYEEYESSKLKLENFNPEINLAGMRLSIVISNQPIGKELEARISPYELRNLWKEVFRKVGFTETDFHKWNFQADLPRKFDDSTYWIVPRN